MTMPTERDDGKRPYEKPLLRTIELVAEEVLGIGCKLEDGGEAPLGSTCIDATCLQAGT